MGELGFKPSSNSDRVSPLNLLTVVGWVPRESDSAGHCLGNGTHRGGRGNGKVHDWPERGEGQLQCGLSYPFRDAKMTFEMSLPSRRSHVDVGMTLCGPVSPQGLTTGPACQQLSQPLGRRVHSWHQACTPGVADISLPKGAFEGTVSASTDCAGALSPSFEPLDQWVTQWPPQGLLRNPFGPGAERPRWSGVNSKSLCHLHLSKYAEFPCTCTLSRGLTAHSMQLLHETCCPGMSPESQGPTPVPQQGVQPGCSTAQAAAVGKAEHALGTASEPAACLDLSSETQGPRRRRTQLATWAHSNGRWQENGGASS